jgi:hypothetical protein
VEVERFGVGVGVEVVLVIKVLDETALATLEYTSCLVSTCEIGGKIISGLTIQSAWSTTAINVLASVLSVKSGRELTIVNYCRHTACCIESCRLGRFQVREHSRSNTVPFRFLYK